MSGAENTLFINFFFCGIMFNNIIFAKRTHHRLYFPIGQEKNARRWAHYIHYRMPARKPGFRNQFWRLFKNSGQKANPFPAGTAVL